MVKQLVNGAIDILHDGSIPSIELLQTSFPNNEKLMIGISTLLDPRYVFLIYAPILFALNKKIGNRVIIALTITEWSNQILKWLLAGERPYWYVHERAMQLSKLATDKNIIPTYEFASDLNMTLNSHQLQNLFIYQQDQFSSQQEHQPIAQLRQFPVTCELGAGSPSGHAMVTATVWYVLIDAFLKSSLIRSMPIRLPGGLTASTLSWSIYGIMLLSVSLSRVYLACHFPHQCFFGALLGLLVGWFVCEKISIQRLEKTHFCLATIAMFASVFGAYGFLSSLGFDPLWSVHKGTRWCVKPEYIHLDTSPFSSMMRYIGFCLGSGLAFSNKATTTNGFVKTVTTATISILFGQFILSLPISTPYQVLNYAISFANFTLFSYAIAGPIPKVISDSAIINRISKARID